MPNKHNAERRHYIPKMKFRVRNRAQGIVTPRRARGPSGGPVAKGMKKISDSGYCFPPEIIQQAIWLYLRFTPSFRDVEDLLAERGIAVAYEDWALGESFRADDRGGFAQAPT